MQKRIIVDGFETTANGKKIIIKSGNEKYVLWKEKQDGHITRAYEGFQRANPSIGHSLDIFYKETERTFTNVQGKKINYKENTILFLVFDEKSMMHSTLPPQTQKIEENKYLTQEQFDAFKIELESWKSDMWNAVNNIKSNEEFPPEDLKVEDIPF